jgi:hypothetical protein
MTSLTVRPPYSQAELDKLYPANLELQLVQILLRHGERTPVSTRFQNVGRLESPQIILTLIRVSRLVSRPIGHTAMQRNGCVPL